MWLKRLIKYILIFSALVILLVGLLIGSVYIGIFGPLPNSSQLIGINHEEASVVVSNDGTIIGKYFAENRTNVKWDDLPDQLINALISTEDKRFFEHKGIDGRSYLRVIFKTILLGNDNSGGGSTITQQLVKNLYGRTNHDFLSLPVSKVREAIIAYRMEKVLSKEEILLLYFNSVPFGEEVYGIEAAAKRYFDLSTKELNVQESAVLVGLLKANTFYNPRLHPENAIKRRNQVLYMMMSQNYINESQYNNLKTYDLGLKYTNFQKESEAGYFVYQLKKRARSILENLRDINGETYDLKTDGLLIRSTLNIDLQELANAAAEKQLKKMQALLDKELSANKSKQKWVKELSIKDKDTWYQKHKLDVIDIDGIKTLVINKIDSLWHYQKMLNAAVLAVDPNNGKILVWRGGNNFRFLPYDMVMAKRQIASTVKPIIYAAAIESGIGPCEYFSNQVVEYEEYDGWKPENYDHSQSEDTKVAMWYALSRSMNLPTVEIYFETGHENMADLCSRLGLKTPYETTPSIALGSLDASLFEMVRAYSAFADHGYIPDNMIMIESIEDSEGNIIFKNGNIEKTKVMSQETADVITAILEVAIDEGTGRRIRNTYNFKSDLAGKTGTAQNYSDAWFISYTADIVIGSWVGASSPQMHFNNGNGSGSALALPISAELLSKMEKKSDLREAYLGNFYIEDEIYNQIDCDPFKEKGIKGLFSKKGEKQISNKQLNDSISINKNGREKKKDGKFKSFFKNIFKKKDKEKK